MLRRDYTIVADLDSGYATIKFYETKYHYEEDNEITDQVKETGWVRISMDDIGKAMKERSIKEFSTEDDMRFYIQMHESTKGVQ